MKVGIRGRLLLLTLGVAIPLALVGVLALNRMGTPAAQLDDSVRQQAELAAIGFERWVDAQRQPLTTIAALAAHQNINTAGSELQYSVSTRPYWIGLDIVDASGKILASEPTNRERPSAALIQYLLRETASRIRALD